MDSPKDSHRRKERMSALARHAAQLTLLALAICPVYAQAEAEEDHKLRKVTEFVYRIEETINELDPSFFRSKFDFNEFWRRSTRGIKSDSFLKGMKSGVRSTFDMADNLVKDVEAYDGTFTFLRIMSDEPVRALFRQASDSGLNYFELELQVTAGGSVTIADIYNYWNGAWASRSIRRVVIAAMADEDKGLVAKLLDGDSGYLKALERLRDINLTAATDPQRAWKQYRDLPDEMRDRFEFRTFGLQLAGSVSDEAYTAEMEAFRRLFPDSPALDLMLIDYYILNENFDLAQATVDRLDKRVHSDPYLDLMRGQIFVLGGERDKGRATILAGIERDPDLEYEGMWSLLEIALEQKDHKSTLDLLLRFETDYGIEWNDLSQEPHYVNFAASPQYQEWLDRSTSTGDGE